MTVLMKTRMKLPRLEPVKLGEQVERFGRINTVLPQCPREEGGGWFCITCKHAAPNNLELHSHLEIRGVHRVAFCCPEHGMEAW